MARVEALALRVITDRLVRGRLIKKLSVVAALIIVSFVFSLAAYAADKETSDTKEYKDPATGMEFVLVKGGCYMMGDTFGDGLVWEKPVHEVCVDDFYMGKYDVTQGQWQPIMEHNPSFFKECGDNCPVESVSWDDVQKFIKKLYQRTGKDYRLPTEAEWEYAAKSGGKNEKWAGTSNESDLEDYAWYGSNSRGRTHPVGEKQPNGVGLYDMSGNVWQWVQDWYDSNYYKSSPRNNPTGPNSSALRVVRGGCWKHDARSVRTARRSIFAPESRDVDLGFRLARTP